MATDHHFCDETSASRDFDVGIRLLVTELTVSHVSLHSRIFNSHRLPVVTKSVKFRFADPGLTPGRLALGCGRLPRLSTVRRVRAVAPCWGAYLRVRVLASR